MKLQSCFGHLLIIGFFCPVTVFAQVNTLREDKGGITDSQIGNQVFKTPRILEAQQENLEVINLTLATIGASNLVDGTMESYNHKLRITYSLQVLGGKGAYQVVFYRTGEKIPYAVNNENGVTAIYMPLDAHDYFRAKVEQALNLKKKVQLKINLLTSGLREAVWIL